MNFKTLTCMALLTTTMYTLAQEEESNRSGFFIGGEIGYSQINLPNDDESALVGAFGGYRFNPYFGIEGGITHFADYEDDFEVRRGTNRDVTKSIDGLRVMVYGRLPINAYVGVHAKAGIIFSQITEYREDSDDSITIKNEDEDGGPAWEVGLDFKVARNWQVNIDAGIYDTEVLDFTLNVNDDTITLKDNGDDIEFVKVGISYQF